MNGDAGVSGPDHLATESDLADSGLFRSSPVPQVNAGRDSVAFWDIESVGNQIRGNRQPMTVA